MPPPIFRTFDIKSESLVTASDELFKDKSLFLNDNNNIIEPKKNPIYMLCIHTYTTVQTTHLHIRKTLNTKNKCLNS